MSNQPAEDIGVISTPIDTLDDFFWTAEFVFGICFAVEISFKFAAFGIVGFWKYAWNWMDLFVATWPEVLFGFGWLARAWH